jgi:uridine kinase
MGIVIGIGGVSRSGKSSLSKQIREWYSQNTVEILSMDEYVFPESHIPKVRDETDWEVPDSVDYEKLASAISHSREKTDLLIVEGILIFNDLKVSALFDKKIFIDIDYETFITRKKADTRWNEPGWYIEHIWTSYLVYGKMNTEDAFLVSGNAEFPRDKIMDFIGQIS